MKLPKKLFKYESFNNYSIRNLKNAQMYFNAPLNFNDPFDCAVLEESLSYSKKDVLLLYNKYVSEGKIGSSKVTNYNDIHPLLIKSIENAISTLVQETQERYLTKIGCSCFSETNKNILMWGHYSDGHRGFCLEFDTSYDPFSKAKKVTYGKDYLRWNACKLILEKDEEQLESDLFLPLTRKDKDWKYEREWRIFHKEQNKLYGYEIDALKAIYFGLASNTADIEIVCLIILGQNPNVKFYKAIKGTASYEVTFKEFFYISHIDSVNQSSPQTSSPQDDKS